MNTSQALQSFATELAFLAPGLSSPLAAVVVALDTLLQSPQAQGRADLLSRMQQERQWAQQVVQGLIPLTDSDLRRLQATYAQIEEALLSPTEQRVESSEKAQPELAGGVLETEAFILIKETDDLEFLNEFCTEGRDLLEQIEQGVLVLEGEPAHKDMLNQVFRAFHTFKGNAGILNLVPVKHLAHELESLLDAVRKGRLPIDRRVINLILAGGDAMRKYVDLIGQRLAGVDSGQAVIVPVNALIARVKNCLAGKEDEQPVQQAPVAVQQTPIATLGHAVVADPQAPATQPATQPANPSPTKNNMGPTAEGPVNFVKLDTRKLDQLVDLVGELVIAQSMVVEDPHVQALQRGVLASQLRQLSRITTDLQLTAMSLRMIPIRGIFQKMGRLVRDLAISQNKKVQLQLLGEDTEIDRNMVEELADPLMHMIRNAVDHGVESPQTRQQNAKPEVGTIKLQAYHRGGGIVISISDDGKGMDPERILNKAIERRLIAADAVLSKTEIFDLIFQPGFSTAEAVTDISGRGVGMDVVRGHISRLRGRIEVQSTLGHGSEFIIRLPLTLAIIDGMMVSVGEERFILPTLSIRESFKPQEGMISKVQGRGELVMVRGKLIPLVRLNEQLEIASGIAEPIDGIVVVVESRSQLRGILVDRLIGKSEVVIKPLGETFKHAHGLTGSAILGDGRVALILDPDTLGSLQKTSFRSATEPAQVSHG
jgi:two-component system chemotaxis sensor kinase CheA